MDNQLPIINGNRATNTTITETSSLISRALLDIQSKKTDIAQTEVDARYRQARDIYNRITDYGEESRFKVELLPTQEELLKEPLLKQLQPFYNLMKQLAEVFTVFQQLADKGYGKAYFPLANMYRGGQGISANIEKADYYSRMAFDWCFANQALNDPELWTDLGWMYDYVGGGVVPDDEYMFSFNHENVPSNLREWYQTSWDPADDAYYTFGFAMLWYHKAADRGYARAQYNVGFAYENNPGTDQDFEVAALWYREAAEQGYARAQCHSARMYQNGYDVEQDREPFFWHLENVHLEQAVFWYRESAKQGYANAQFDLGEIYEDTFGGIDVDFEQAVFWYRKAAEQGHAMAQCNLGSMNEGGRGVEQDYEQAVFWYRQSAEQGYAVAQYYLGWMYESGRGIDQDDEQAAIWIHKAAEQGDTYAQNDLGLMYENGRGVEQDYEQAVFWYRKAAEKGNASAQTNLTNRGINWKDA